MDWHGRHIISIEDFARDEILAILRYARSLEQRPRPDLLAGMLMGTLFFEPSTRTRLSFEAAMCKLGGKVIGFSDSSTTSARKGESLADTIRMVHQYTDVLVMRHPKCGAARLASEVSRVPVINGGDGSNQHPTQTFLDLYTIEKLFPGRLEGQGEPLTVAFAGDLRYGRTVHSLLSALNHFRAQVILVPVPGLEMPDHCLEQARATGNVPRCIPSLAEALPCCDVLYMTRLQQERFPDPVEFEHIRHSYRIDAAMLGGARPHLAVLHPLPRVQEIDPSVDSTPHAAYFSQAGNGIPIRQALLSLVLGRS